jgi:hypothetical protein
VPYIAGCDASGGRNDSFTAAICHRERDGKIVLDAKKCDLIQNGAKDGPAAFQCRKLRNHLLIIQQTRAARRKYWQGIHINGGTIQLGLLIADTGFRKGFNHPVGSIFIANYFGRPRNGTATGSGA